MSGTILNALRAALRIFSGKKILNFGLQESLRTFLKPIFTGRGLGGEQHLPRLLPLEAAARRGAGLPSPSVRCTHCHLSQRERPWHGGTVSGSNAKLPVSPVALPLRKDFPRPGQILPAPGRNVTAGDKERNRCRAATKRGIWRGAPERARPLVVKPQRLPVPARSSPLFEAERAERSQQKTPPAFAGGALDFIHNTDAPP